MLFAKRDSPAVKRLFKKMMRADHCWLPFSISVDKHASYLDAIACFTRREGAAKGLQT
jgi:transposase-like protein